MLPLGQQRGALAFGALALLSIGALAFDLTLSSRLPSAGDYGEAAAFLRGHARAGDAVQIWPPWLEQARLYVDVGPVLAEEDLAHADYVGAQTLWLLALPGSPHANFAHAEEELRARGATPQAAALHFGPLTLTGWDLHAPPLASDLAFANQPREWHEVQYVSHACRVMPVGGERDPSRLVLTGDAGTALHLRAGIVGERAYDSQVTPIRVEAFASDRKLGEVVLPRTVDPLPAWLGADVPSGASGPLQLELRAWAPGPFRPNICVAAWTTR